MKSTDSGIMGVLTRQIRKLASGLREKPNTTLDDYLLEHLMLYHGLVGTSPENERKFKDVRRDVLDAIKHGSSSELGIALKLPPLRWDDKLAAIFSEAQASLKDKLASCLLPDTKAFEGSPESDPLRHPDWKVRANAARILAHLNMVEAVPRLAEALNDQADDQKAAFCHLTYSLARLQTAQSYNALVAQLNNDEPWFAVDAAAGLAQWPLEQAAADLMPAMLTMHLMSDYSAVAIGKRYGMPALFMQKEPLSEGTLEVAIGLIEAKSQTFASEVVVDTQLQSCLDSLAALCAKKTTPRRLNAAIGVAQWIQADIDNIVLQDRTASKQELLSQASALLMKFSPEHVSACVISLLKENQQSAQDPLQLRHAVKLAAQFKLQDSSPYLVSLAYAGSATVDDAIDAIAALCQPDSAPHLIALAGQLVNLSERTSKDLSKQPVFEDDKAATKTYFRIIKALGSLPSPQSAAFLLTCCRDFASDKRQEALASLILVGKSGNLEPEVNQQIAQAVKAGLNDPAPTVRTAALKGIGDLHLPDLLPEVVQQLYSKEASILRQSADTLRHLHASGYAKNVEEALAVAISHERDHFKSKRLQSLSQSLKQ